MKFNYEQDFKKIDFRKHPELYQVGRGEQGVLLVEPYKGEILPHWRFKTPDIAKKSSAEIYQLYEAYKEADDFVGMDMARKFIQMGYTRAMRYAHHKSGRKYDDDRKVMPNEDDDIKRQSALIFKEYWDKIRADADYQRMKKEHKDRYEQ
ncbi:DUF4385 domain-containing protein [Macrococcus equipercicus]|uniref:DUF4385 domain-containing protein n=1 Tax=Macrococcus equipercicus TaxID=69967 RepID=A0A9Q9BWB6_9STAP|nr:DUF4385 domain-containing protein [Macrococcus equipercicus]KAA1042344.1 DUF4385 domain-containing protein [Macrococcus equipercicus]UTH14228.1 DUF4385 domain-containing protein [Macrococcus equipercicus]